MDLISKYNPEELPPALTSFVKDRGKYDYLHHCEVGSDNADFRQATKWSTASASSAP